MLFMGEEVGASTPWQFFTDHTDLELAEAVSRGRRREFAAHGWKEEDIPDPQDPATRDRSCLDWSEPDGGDHARLLAWHRELIALRAARGRPDRSRPGVGAGRVRRGGRAGSSRRGDLRIVLNLGKEPVPVPLGGDHARVLAAWEPAGRGAGRGRRAAAAR
ncbi:Malto-oligosyltrehalose trehalohydrolase OS=Streptomyces alboniger OX=132473 GN=treZ PE=3 SV=1 [Streptomyces alboniger]